MPEIKYKPMEWHALFVDGSSLDQFTDKGDLLTFKAVLTHPSPLKSLSIVDLNNIAYTVMMADGMFAIDDKCMYLFDTNLFPTDKLENIRPIYFERWQQDFSATSVQPLGHNQLFTAIGFQAIFNGKNIKRYLEVYPSGNIKIREK